MRPQEERTNAELIYSLIREKGFTGVLAVHTNWTYFSRHRSGVQYLSEHGIPVWETTPDAVMDFLGNPADPKHTLVYLLFPPTIHTWQLDRTLAKRGYKRLIRNISLLPEPTRRVMPSPGSIKTWIFQRATGFMLRHHTLFRISPVDFFLGGGRKSYCNPRYPVGPHTQYLNGHAEDYDTYIELARKGRARVEDPKTAVFLDGDDFHHPDLMHIGRGAPPWEGAYYARLRRFFDSVESTLGVRIVIAAHPLSRNLDSSKFGGREIIQGNTGELVMDSSLVIVHASTAIDFGVLFWKPIIFITDRDYESYYIGPLIESMAKALGKEPVYIDDTGVDLSVAMDIDPAAYHRYIDEYIITKEPS